jgi:hypothetical protein
MFFCSGLVSLLPASLPLAISNPCAGSARIPLGITMWSGIPCYVAAGTLLAQENSLIALVRNTFKIGYIPVVSACVRRSGHPKWSISL